MGPEQKADAVGTTDSRACAAAGAAVRRVSRRLVIVALIAGLPAVMFAGVWRLGGAAALGDDLIYYLPVRQYIGERIRAGELPLWNPLASMGTSIAADPQSGLWYPFTALFVVLPPLAAYSLSVYLHFVLAGWGMYRFLRSGGRVWQAALLGAIAFEFSGYLVAHRGHLTILQAVAWLPWMFYGWQRFAQTGRYPHFALAAAAFGMQLLVQHIQPSIITAALLTGYVAVVLWPQRRSLAWQYPAGMVVGTLLAGVQLAPTWFHFAGSGRAAAAWYLFVENSWALPSALMFLFPFVYGAAMPNVWSEPWWGVSHFCEQWPYGTILILLLAAASVGMVGRPSIPGGETERRRGGRQSRDRKGVDDPDGSLTVAALHPRREVLFWWGASLVALVLAVGDLTPVSRLLFHVPVYASLRVPARWILVWSVAMPVVASLVVSVLLAGGAEAERLRRTIRWIVTRGLPVAAGGSLLLLVMAAVSVRMLDPVLSSSYAAQVSGLQRAVRPGNPAIWWPLVLMAVTGFLLVRWSRHVAQPPSAGQTQASVAGKAQPGTTVPHTTAVLFVVFLIDIASVAPFVDVDFHTYTPRHLREEPPLATVIRRLEPEEGHRLLVPRSTASYYRPLEVLWPQANMPHGIATLNGYGPLWPAGNRLLFRFMAWGSSEDMLALLRNTPLLESMGVRFIAVRSAEERALLNAAAMPALPEGELGPVPGTEVMLPVPSVDGLLWPVRIDAAGVYELTFDAESVARSSSRWFVRIETTPHDEIDATRSLDPVDLSQGPRRMRFVFECPDAVGDAFVRIKSERGTALLAGRGVFGRIAGEGAADFAAARASDPRFMHRADVPGNILEGGTAGNAISEVVSVYELPGALPVLWPAERLTPVKDLVEAVERLTAHAEEVGLPGGVVIEWPGDEDPPVVSAEVELAWQRPSGHEVQVQMKSLAGALLVFKESYDPGWAVTTDGRPTTIHRVNAVCQGVVVPAGEHAVRLRYRPRGLIVGLVATAAGLCLLVGGGAWARHTKGAGPFDVQHSPGQFSAA
jgi:hypothetical protein